MGNKELCEILEIIARYQGDNLAISTACIFEVLDEISSSDTNNCCLDRRFQAKMFIMSEYANICELDLISILQRHYGRFISSAEFVKQANDKAAVDIVFADGTKKRISKGNNNENRGNMPRVSAAMARTPA